MPSVLRTLPLATLALLAGCGEAGLSGSFGDAEREVRYDFHPAGRVRITMLGASVAGQYTLQDDKVIVTSPQGTVVLTRRGQSLHGPRGVALQRQSPVAEPLGDADNRNDEGNTP